jgi:hypothetical protein
VQMTNGALLVGAMDQLAAHAGGAHLGEGDLVRAGQVRSRTFRSGRPPSRRVDHGGGGTRAALGSAGSKSAAPHQFKKGPAH